MFAHHKSVVEGLAGELTRLSGEGNQDGGNFRFIRIDGAVPGEMRMQLVRQFQTDPETRVALLSIMAAGTGLTFTAGSHVVFAELHWTPGILQVRLLLTHPYRIEVNRLYLRVLLTDKQHANYVLNSSNARTVFIVSASVEPSIFIISLLGIRSTNGFGPLSRGRRRSSVLRSMVSSFLTSDRENMNERPTDTCTQIDRIKQSDTA